MENNIKNIDFYQKAQKFMESQLPSDFGEKLKEFIEKENFNSNENLLFESMMKDVIGFHTMMVKYKITNQCICESPKTKEWYGDAFMCECGKPYIEK